MTAATLATSTVRDLLIDGLDYAYQYLTDKADCHDCTTAATGVCSPEHEDDRALADQISRLRRRILAADPGVFEIQVSAALRGTGQEET